MLCRQLFTFGKKTSFQLSSSMESHPGVKPQHSFPKHRGNMKVHLLCVCYVLLYSDAFAFVLVCTTTSDAPCTYI